MKIYLGGHLNFYHPLKEKWLEIKPGPDTRLIDILNQSGIPLGEVHLVVINEETVELVEAVVSDKDEVKLYSAVGGG